MFRFVNALRNRKGFTLIELLVVLAVLAIIALIAVPNFIGIKEKSKEKADLSSCLTIKRGIELGAISGDIKTVGTICTFTVNAAGTATTYTSSLSGNEETDSEKYFNNGTTFQKKSATYVFVLDSNNKVKVTNGASPAVELIDINGNIK